MNLTLIIDLIIKLKSYYFLAINFSICYDSKHVLEHVWNRDNLWESDRFPFRMSGARFVEVVRSGVEENLLAMNSNELSKKRYNLFAVIYKIVTLLHLF